MTRVDTALCCDLMCGTATKNATFTHIWALGVFTDDNEVMRCGVSRRSARERTLVHKEVEIKTHLQKKATLDDARRNIRGTDGAQQDGIKVA